MEKDLIDISQLTRNEIIAILDLADQIKANPNRFSVSLKEKTLLMIFEKPSLRTRLSFEVGMTQMGGHAIYYDIASSPMGKKESVADTAKTASRYVDIIMARMFSHEQLIELAQNASVPVINALTDFSHPCQILGDLQTIREKKGKLIGIKLAYLGDSNNNVTHSLLHGCTLVGMDISLACPKGKAYEPNSKVLEEAKRFAKVSGSKVVLTNSAEEAVKEADVVYTDSWMSYHIPVDQNEKRVKIFKPYQVNSKLMAHAKPDAVFMNCLPAMRDMEQTPEVIDGPQSIVFDQAENRLNTQKALMLLLLKVK